MSCLSHNMKLSQRDVKLSIILHVCRAGNLLSHLGGGEPMQSIPGLQERIGRSYIIVLSRHELPPITG
jgi:hypothetical protein